jgi:hypothetical protein
MISDEQAKAIQEVRTRAENDLEAFIRLVHPQRVLGSVHKELISWWNRQDAMRHQLVLLPRDHGKSAMIAYRVAWTITRRPDVRILYLSATSTLSIKQLKFIKDILTCANYRRYWPEMVNLSESSREKWSETEIAVDHPKRKEEAVRDPTIFTGGLTTTITGLHFDIAVLDDVVVDENANTEDGRQKVAFQYSLLASVEGTEAEEWVVGTRYFPTDLYYEMISMEVETYDKETGKLLNSEPLYEVFEKQVESMGDGTGEFLWPRQQRYDGRWFGFDERILNEKKAKYLDKGKFYAQYYNNPNLNEGSGINPELFQYYDPVYLHQKAGIWYFRDRKLNVFAAIDFAFSIKEKADFSCIVTVGIDSDKNIYVFEVDRFKTDQISEYYNHILRAHAKWGFRKLRAEITSAQEIIVKDIKNNYIRPNGLALSVEEHRPTRYMGSKDERINAILEPRYANRQIWHYKGGNCELLEQELILKKPPHDDIKDGLAAAVDCAIPPSNLLLARNYFKKENQSYQHSRFGGIM